MRKLRTTSPGVAERLCGASSRIGTPRQSGLEKGCRQIDADRVVNAARGVCARSTSLRGCRNAHESAMVRGIARAP